MGDQQQFETLSAPDPRRPDFHFREGRYIVSLKVLPAALPLWMTASSGGGLDDAFFDLAVEGLAGRVDRRWKVVTLRDRYFRLPQVIGLEICATEEEAEARRVELLRTWVPGSAATARPIKMGERRRLRRRAGKRTAGV